MAELALAAICRGLAGCTASRAGRCCGDFRQRNDHLSTLGRRGGTDGNAFARAAQLAGPGIAPTLSLSRLPYLSHPFAQRPGGIFETNCLLGPASLGRIAPDCRTPASLSQC